MQQTVVPGTCRALACAGAVAVGVVLSLASASPASADSGYATWYGPGFQGNPMYNGQIYDMYDPTTTACNIYPLGTWIRVTNPVNGRTVVVQVRDRGYFHHALDLSYAAFARIGNPNLMMIPVVYQVVSGPSGDPVAPRAAPSSRGGRPAASAGGAAATQYVVQPGDTLADIAASAGVDAHSLADWNGLADADLLEIGQTLRLTPPSKTAPTPPTPTTYVVQLGDSLSSIADTFGTTPLRLADANQIADPNIIQPGATLTIPAP